LVRILITRGLGEVGLETNRARPPVIPGETSPRRGAGDPLWVIYAQEKPPRLESEYHHGWRVITSSIPKNAQSWLERTKTISRVHHVMAKAEAEAADVNDAVMLNTNGHLTEGTTSNLFLIKRGRLLTSPISDGLLGGITRAAILELAHHLRFPAQEIHLRSRHLYSADEAFLTSTLLEIMPITEVDGRKISRGRIGPLTARLRREFRELVRRELGVDVPAIRG